MIYKCSYQVTELHTTMWGRKCRMLRQLHCIPCQADTCRPGRERVSLSSLPSSFSRASPSYSHLIHWRFRPGVLYSYGSKRGRGKKKKKEKKRTRDRRVYLAHCNCVAENLSLRYQTNSGYGVLSGFKS